MGVSNTNNVNNAYKITLIYAAEECGKHLSKYLCDFHQRKKEGKTKKILVSVSSEKMERMLYEVLNENGFLAIRRRIHMS